MLSHNPQLICACLPPCIAGQKKDRKERKADRKERLAARKAERTGLSKQARREWELPGWGAGVSRLVFAWSHHLLSSV